MGLNYACDGSTTFRYEYIKPGSLPCFAVVLNFELYSNYKS